MDPLARTRSRAIEGLGFFTDALYPVLIRILIGTLIVALCVWMGVGIVNTRLNIKDVFARGWVGIAEHTNIDALIILALLEVVSGRPATGTLMASLLNRPIISPSRSRHRRPPDSRDHQLAGRFHAYQAARHTGGNRPADVGDRRHTGGSGSDAAAGQGPFELALIGDMPYIASNAPGTPYPLFDRLVEAINRDHRIKWVLHAGDIKNGSTLCSDELLLDRLERLNRIEKPLVYTPGDNEWTDCHRVNNGQYQPLERLARLRQIFFPVPGMTLGGVPMRVESQGLLPGYEEFPENVRWTHNGVVFATLHIVGSNDARAPFQAGSSAVRTAADDAEVARRNEANLAWLDATFDQAERDGAPGVFIMIQANPGLEFRQSVADRYGFETLLAALENRAAAYGRPVVLAHGDSHFFRVDKPRLLNRPFLRNLTRVETFGAGNVHWIRVSVDPRSEQVFRFEPQLVDDNP